MDNLYQPSVISKLLKEHGFSFSRTLGQNFLINEHICPRMVEMCGVDADSGVLEIGPGIGVLTRELARKAQKVVSVEIDSRLIPVLAQTLGDYPNVKVIEGDILKLDLHAFLQEHFDGMRVYVCANLPYYITSPIIMRLLEEKLPVDAITVMVQKEAALRLCAKPGQRACGAVSVAVRYFAEPEILFQVSRGSFYPAPHVDSAVIRLHVRSTPAVQVMDEKLFFDIVRASFSQRRKTLLNSLSAGLGLPKAKVTEVLQKAGVAENLRAEQLPLTAFSEIADAFTADREENENGRLGFRENLN